MKYKAIPILIFLLFSPTLLSFAYAQPQIGEKAPGFITSTLDGKRIALKDYWEQQGKKVLVLSFFATWCHPCREDLKYLQKSSGPTWHFWCAGTLYFHSGPIQRERRKGLLAKAGSDSSCANGWNYEVYFKVHHDWLAVY